MYTKILHNTKDLSYLEDRLYNFRAKIVMKKLYSTGISRNDVYSVIEKSRSILELQ